MPAFNPINPTGFRLILPLPCHMYKPSKWSLHFWFSTRSLHTFINVSDHLTFLELNITRVIHAYNGTTRHRFFFRCRQVPVNICTWSTDHLDCKIFPLKTDFLYSQVPFKTGLTVSGEDHKFFHYTNPLTVLLFFSPTNPKYYPQHVVLTTISLSISNVLPLVRETKSSINKVLFIHQLMH